ncbi:hypothetical protein IscW_ISCW002064, partial [Ixodes scapularis]
AVAATTQEQAAKGIAWTRKQWGKASSTNSTRSRKTPPQTSNPSSCNSLAINNEKTKQRRKKNPER